MKDGQILTGSQVVEAIKKLKDTEGVVVSTQDKNKHVNVYGNNVSVAAYTEGDPDDGIKPLIGTLTIDGASIKDVTIGATDETKVDLSTKIQKVDTATLKLMGDKNSSFHYVTPSRKFRGTVHRNTTTNSIDWIEFTQE